MSHFHTHKFEADSQAANQTLNKGHHETPLWVEQTHAQQLEELLSTVWNYLVLLITRRSQFGRIHATVGSKTLVLLNQLPAQYPLPRKKDVWLCETKYIFECLGEDL